MLWELRYERDGFSVEAAIRKKRKLPPDHWYLNEPEAPEGAEFFREAFDDLITCRTYISNYPGPIPWTAVREYGIDMELDADLRALLWTVIRQMDWVDREWTFENLPKPGG